MEKTGTVAIKGTPMIARQITMMIVTVVAPEKRHGELLKDFPYFCLRGQPASIGETTDVLF